MTTSKQGLWLPEDDMKKVASTDFSIAAPYMNKLKPIGRLEIFYKSGVKDRS